MGGDCIRWSGKVRFIASLEWSACRSLGMSHGRDYQYLTNSTTTAHMNVQPRANTAEINTMPELFPLCTYDGAFFFVAF